MLDFVQLAIREWNFQDIRLLDKHRIIVKVGTQLVCAVNDGEQLAVVASAFE